MVSRAPVCCTLCGVLIQPFDESNPDSWLGRVRAARSYRGHNYPFLTGTGYLRNGLYLLTAPSDSEKDAGQIQPQHSELHDPFAIASGDNGRCFVFHDTCWRLLNEQVRIELSILPLFSSSAHDFRKHSDNEIAKRLFHLLVTLELHDKTQLPRGTFHYGDAASAFPPATVFKFPLTTEVFGTSIVGPFKLSSAHEYLLSDPDDIGIVFEESNLPLRSGIQSKWMAGYYQKTSKVDVFEKLPEEVIHHILCFLSSNDVISTIHASGAVSIASIRHKLPQSFWKSRFTSEQEMNFVLPLALKKNFLSGLSLDWRRLYSNVETALGQPDPQYAGLKNRKRIWQLLRNITQTIVPMLRKHSSEEAPWLRPRSSHLPFGYTIGERVDSCVAHEGPTQYWIRGPAQIPTHGCQTLFWPCDPVTQTLRIGISEVIFDGRKFISGIRVRPLEGSLSMSRLAGMTAGIVNEDLETWLTVQNGDRLESLQVVSCAVQGGIRSISLSFLRDAGSQSFSVGSLYCCSRDVHPCRSFRKSTLLVPDKCQRVIVGFHIGMDAFRIESIALITKSLQLEAP